MTLIAWQDGGPVMRAGSIGAGAACCCGGTQPCDDPLCCQILVLFNSINYILDPSSGAGIECDANGNPVRGYSDANVTDGTCFGGGGVCTFNVRVYWTATFTRRTTGTGAPCYEVDNPVFDDLVFTSVNCPNCQNNISDVTFFGQDDPGC